MSDLIMIMIGGVASLLVVGAIGGLVACASMYIFNFFE